MDMTALLSQVMESRLATLMYQNMASSFPKRYVPNSSRIAFDSRMRSDAAMFNQASRNMKDAMSMVNVAQTGATAIRVQLDEMRKLATEMAGLDALETTDPDYETYNKLLEKHVQTIVSLAKGVEFNGKELLNGITDKDGDGINDGGPIILQAGRQQLEQIFHNMLTPNAPPDGKQGTIEDVIRSDGSMNLNAISSLLGATNQEEAKTLVENLDKIIDRVQGIEAEYTYDYQALENLSILLEEKATIFENTIQYKNDNEQDKEEPDERPISASYLEQLMMGSGVNIFTGKG